MGSKSLGPLPASKSWSFKAQRHFANAQLAQVDANYRIGELLQQLGSIYPETLSPNSSLS